MDVFQNSLTLLIEKLHGWLDGIVLSLPNLILAILVISIFIYITRVTKKIVKQGLSKVVKSAVVISLVASIIEIIIFGVGIFIALEVMQLGKVVTSLLAGAGIVGLAMGIAFQDFVANIISGVYFAVKKPLHVGDFIETAGIYGKVHEMGLRSTVVKLSQGQYVYIPNREIFQTPLTNFSQMKRRRVDLRVGIGYGEELESVREIAIKAIEVLPVIDKKYSEIEFFYEEFGDSSINFVIRFWIPFKRQQEYKEAVSEAIIAIKKSFDKKKINIPFPIRTLDIDTKALGKAFSKK